MVKIINEKELNKVCEEVRKILIKKGLTVDEGIFVLKVLQNYLTTTQMATKKIKAGDVKYAG